MIWARFLFIDIITYEKESHYQQRGLYKNPEKVKP